MSHNQLIATLRDIAETPTLVDTARQHGIRISTRSSYAPLNERENYTIPQASQVFGIDYRRLLMDVDAGLIETFRPRSRRGTLGRRRINRKEIERYISQFY